MSHLKPNPKFPTTRLRRTRQASWIRSLVSEHVLNSSDLILPIFIMDGNNRQEPVVSMPGVYCWTVDLVPSLAATAHDLGIRLLALFPRTNHELRTPNASEALNPENLVCRAVRAIKKEGIEIGTLCDVALDPYSSHGHDGILKHGSILNDETVEILCEQALVQAQAGFDVIAPSDMMDGRIGRIRATLDASGYQDIPIMAYAAKYASSFYGPFREAVSSSSILQGDKKTYQMDPANSDEAMREVALDIAEGADMVMVKPGLAYLDILYRVKTTFGMPTFVYNVSGEYAMLRAATNNDLSAYEIALMEILTAFKRAGADGILTYSAIDAAKILQRK